MQPAQLLAFFVTLHRCRWLRIARNQTGIAPVISGDYQVAASAGFLTAGIRARAWNPPEASIA
jgi:hypothetical protein